MNLQYYDISKKKPEQNAWVSIVWKDTETGEENECDSIWVDDCDMSLEIIPVRWRHLTKEECSYYEDYKEELHDKRNWGK